MLIYFMGSGVALILAIIEMVVDSKWNTESEITNRIFLRFLASWLYVGYVFCCLLAKAIKVLRG